MRAQIKRFVPLLVLVAVIGGLAIFGPDDRAVLEALRANREAVVAFVAAHAVAAPLVYMALYVAVVALSLPGGAMMTVIGGFLFGPLRATLYVVVAASVGATLLFVIARSAVGERMRRRAGPWMRRMEAGFHRDAFSYLLFLRLVPVFPFFVVNLVPAFLGVPLRTYVAATVIGIIPGTIVFALAGSGLGRVLDAGASFDPSLVLTPDIIGALVGLAALAVAPALVRRWRGRGGDDEAAP